MNGAGVLAVAANQDQNGSRFLLLGPVIMRGEHFKHVKHHFPGKLELACYTLDFLNNGFLFEVTRPETHWA